jgi:hypothetical protein
MKKKYFSSALFRSIGLVTQNTILTKSARLASELALIKEVILPSHVDCQSNLAGN